MRYWIYFCFLLLSACRKSENTATGSYLCRIQGSSQFPGSSLSSWDYVDTIDIYQNGSKIEIQDHFEGVLGYNSPYDLVDNKFSFTGGREYLNGYFVSDSLYYIKNYQGPGGNSYYAKNDCKCNKL